MIYIVDYCLKDIPLFADLQQPDLSLVKDRIYLREYQRNDILFLEGDSSDAFYIVVSGQVKITKMSESGREKILKVMNPGDFFGEMGLIENKPRSASAEITKKTKLIILNKADFMRLLKDYPSVASNMIRELSQRLRKADRDIENLAFYTVEGRLKRLLYSLAEDKGKKENKRLWISRSVTHRELARHLGTSRETVTRVINRLEEADQIEITEERIYLKNINID